MAEEKWIKSPWTISIGTAIFTLLLPMGYDFFKEKPILTTVWIIIKWIENIIWTILNFDIKFWWVILAIAFLILLPYIIAIFKKEDSYKPDFYSYREDILKKWRWSWEWKFSDSQKSWGLSNLKAHCPNCDTPMIGRSVSYQMQFDCPRCDFKSSDRQSDELAKIERIITDNIERKRNEKKSNP